MSTASLGLDVPSAYDDHQTTSREAQRKADRWMLPGAILMTKLVHHMADRNIKYGLQVLGFYLEMYQDLEMALTAYNRGPGPVDAALVKGRNPNNGYAPKVLSTYERLKKLNVMAMR